MPGGPRSEPLVALQPHQSPQTEDLSLRSLAQSELPREYPTASPARPRRTPSASAPQGQARGLPPPRATRLPWMPKSPDRGATARCQKTCPPASPTAAWGTPPPQPAGRRRDGHGPACMSQIFVLIFGSALANLFVRIRNRGRNYISAARPFAQVNCAAAVAAEGKLGVAALDGLLADGATEFQDALASHGQRMLQVLVHQTSIGGEQLATESWPPDHNRVLP